MTSRRNMHRRDAAAKAKERRRESKRYRGFEDVVRLGSNRKHTGARRSILFLRGRG